MIKLLHTADHQLGVNSLASAEAVDLVLVAGDLFDSNAVSRNLD